MDKLVTERAFTTGLRKSVAVMNFPLKGSESNEARRKRMHEMVLSISRANAVTPAGKRLWCSYSRTKQQRDISSHSGWVKRAMAAVDSDWAKD